MQGLYGIYTPIGPEVGVNRSLVVNPKIKSTRGFIQPFDLDKATADNLFSIGELLNVFTPKHADSPRAIMASIQGKHTTPTKVQHSYIVGNGSDKALPYIVGNDFAYSSAEDGVVTAIDTKNEVCILKYKDGTNGVIDMRKKASKNSGGGFFIQNTLTLKSAVKVGYKFKKGELLAYDTSFFKEMLDGSVGYAGGTLTKIAVLPLPETFEDSAVFTNRVVDELSSEVINSRQIVLSKNTRIIKMANIGENISVNDPILIFEDVADTETQALKALEKLDVNTKTTIEELARSVAKAKFTGEIFDIRIYYNAELEEMHPTLKAVVDAYIKKYSAKTKIISTIREDEIVLQPSTQRINSDKVMGNDLPGGGVVIEFMIKHIDKMKVGDKATFAIALKAICAETIEEGLEPYSEFRPEETVDGLISPMSLVSRMVPDLYLQGYTNKVIIELEKQCLELLEE